MMLWVSVSRPPAGNAGHRAVEDDLGRRGSGVAGVARGVVGDDRLAVDAQGIERAAGAPAGTQRFQRPGQLQIFRLLGQPLLDDGTRTIGSMAGDPGVGQEPPIVGAPRVRCHQRGQQRGGLVEVAVLHERLGQPPTPTLVFGIHRQQAPVFGERTRQIAGVAQRLGEVGVAAAAAAPPHRQLAHPRNVVALTSCAELFVENRAGRAALGRRFVERAPLFELPAASAKRLVAQQRRTPAGHLLGGARGTVEQRQRLARTIAAELQQRQQIARAVELGIGGQCPLQRAPRQVVGQVAGARRVLELDQRQRQPRHAALGPATNQRLGERTRVGAAVLLRQIGGHQRRHLVGRRGRGQIGPLAQQRHVELGAAGASNGEAQAMTTGGQRQRDHLHARQEGVLVDGARHQLLVDVGQPGLLALHAEDDVRRSGRELGSRQENARLPRGALQHHGDTGPLYRMAIF